LRILNALRHNRPLPPFELFFTLRNLSRQLVVLSQYGAALDVLRFIEELLLGFEAQLEVPGVFHFDLAATLGSLAPLLAGNNDISEARAVCARALLIAESLSNPFPHPILPLLLRVQCSFEETEEVKLLLLSRAINIYERLVAHQHEDKDAILVRLAETLSSRGRLLLKATRTTAALQDLDRAKQIFEPVGAITPEHLGVCLVRLGQTYNLLGDSKKLEGILIWLHRSWTICQPTEMRWQLGHGTIH
jgi:tetratricopeptide (TPR) repeat protein